MGRTGEESVPTSLLYLPTHIFPAQCSGKCPGRSRQVKCTISTYFTCHFHPLSPLHAVKLNPYVLPGLEGEHFSGALDSLARAEHGSLQGRKFSSHLGSVPYLPSQKRISGGRKEWSETVFIEWNLFWGVERKQNMGSREIVTSLQYGKVKVAKMHFHGRTWAVGISPERLAFRGSLFTAPPNVSSLSSV